MNERLLEIINYKTGGSRKEFAELMGWSQPYMTKLLKNDFGIKPVISILEKLPEINSRWFLLGTGNMLDDARLTDIRKATHEYISKILDLEKYMPVMSAGELKEYEQAVTGAKKVRFSPETVSGWAALLERKNNETEARFRAAYRECKTPRARK